MKVVESHGKQSICFQKIKRQKDIKFEKITNKSATAFNFSVEIDTRTHFMHFNAGKYVKSMIGLILRREQLLNLGHGKLGKVMESFGKF